jgi:hypothetical protein
MLILFFEKTGGVFNNSHLQWKVARLGLSVFWWNGLPRCKIPINKINFNPTGLGWTRLTLFLCQKMLQNFRSTYCLLEKKLCSSSHIFIFVSPQNFLWSLFVSHGKVLFPESYTKSFCKSDLTYTGEKYSKEGRLCELDLASAGALQPLPLPS